MSTEISTEQRAIHEAGHFVVAFELFCRFDLFESNGIRPFDYVTLESENPNELAYCKPAPGFPRSNGSVHRAVAITALFLGGEVADELRGCRHPDRCYFKDRQEVVDELQFLGSTVAQQIRSDARDLCALLLGRSWAFDEIVTALADKTRMEWPALARIMVDHAGPPPVQPFCGGKLSS
jgi:hypothetical protein